MFTTAQARSCVDVRLGAHMARHTAACRWEEAGLTPDEIRLLLGHESLATTMVYLNHKVMARIRRRMPSLPSLVTDAAAPPS